MKITKLKDGLMLLMALLWLTTMFLGWHNHYLPAMVLGVVLMLVHMVLGTSHKDELSNSFLRYPLLLWAGLWITSFILSWHFSNTFADQTPTFTILGFHPSFAPTVFFYWIGGMLTLSLGLYLKRDQWLSQDQWDEFVASIREEK